jgi:hypothetical protein
MRRELHKCRLHPYENYDRFVAVSKTARGRAFLSKEHIIPIECFHQLSPVTCLAACVRMVLHYYGVKLDELKFYREARFNRKYEGLCDACIAMPLIKRGFKVATYWNGALEDWGVWTSELASLYAEHEKKALKTERYFKKQNASKELIQHLVHKGIPVIAEVLAGRFYRTTEIGTHMILIRGYTKHGFLICDPWGLQHFISYEHFDRAWIPSKRFGKSMIVITPTLRSLSR